MLVRDGEEYFILSEIAEIFSRNANSIQKQKQLGNISGFKEGRNFYYSFSSCKRRFGNYSETKYRTLRGGDKTARMEEQEKKVSDTPNFSRLENIRDKADADFALQLEKIRELRRENDFEEKKLILADRVKEQAEKLFSALFDEQREFIDKLGIRFAWKQSELAEIQKDFNGVLIRAKEKAKGNLPHD